MRITMQEVQNGAFSIESKVRQYFKKLKFTMRDPVLLVSVVTVAIIVVMFIVAPLITILKESVVIKGHFSLSSYVSIFKNRFSLHIIQNTIKLWASAPSASSSSRGSWR